MKVRCGGRGLGVPLMIALVVLGLILPQHPATAASSITVTPLSATVVEGPDWSFGAPGGRWDFEGPTDGWGMSPSENPPSTFDAWARPSGGSIFMSARRTLHLLYAQTGGVPALSNGHIAVDGTRWDLMSGYVRVDKPAYLFVQSRQCDMVSTSSPRPDCVTENVSSARALETGWNLLTNVPVSGSGWDSAVEGVQLRVCPRVGNSCSTDPETALVTEIAWVRLADASMPNITLQIGSGNPTRVGWQRVPDRGRASDKGEVAAFGSSVTFPAGALEPGSYQFRAYDGSDWGAWSSTVTVQSRPRPVVLQPDALGEASDWSSVVRGDPWDFASTADIDLVSGLKSWSVTNGWLLGTSTYSDPWVMLPMSGKRVNTRRWHRLSIRLDNPGAWHITGFSGLVGRWLWWPADTPTGGLPITGDDVILPGGTGWVHVDLETNPRSRVEEEGGPKRGWSELGEVRAVRWDPHEVKDERGFGIDTVRIGRNDRVNSSEQFLITWRDDGWRTGTTAEVALAGKPGQMGAVIGTVPMTSSQGQLLWTNPGSFRGTYWVRVSLTSSDGARTDTWSTGPLDVTERATFVDVASNNVFSDDIDWMVAGRLASGASDYFRPGDGTRRQEMAAYLYRIAGNPRGVSPTCAKSPFLDIPVDHTFCGEIAWARDVGIAGGFLDGTYRPLMRVSRAAMTAFLHRTSAFLGHDVELDGTCSTKPFDDIATSHDFCWNIAWASNEGITSGYSDGTFRASTEISRGGMAKFVHQMDDAGLS